ncbi:hypothetical protein [Corynebacterium amycolatum]
MTENNGSNQTDAAAQEPAAAAAPRLDGNEAINRAAEQAKSTATRNITELEGLPIPDETANLRSTSASKKAGSNNRNTPGKDTLFFT